MAKRKLIVAGEDLVANSFLLAIAASSATSLYTGGGWLPTPVKVGILVAAGWGFARHNFWKSSSYDPRPRRAMAAMESLTRIPSGDPDIASFLHKWKPEQEFKPEFMFQGDILLVPVLESELRLFMVAAVRRQTNARYGERASRIRSTNGKLRRIKINWVLSENYFVYHHRPRFPLELYRSIMIILAVTHLRRCERSSGKSDWLIGDWSPDGYVEKAIARWLRLYPPAGGPSLARRSFWRRFVN